MFCGNCGAKVQADNKFCPVCGEAIEMDEKVHMSIVKCRDCGKNISMNALECPYCGGTTEKKKKEIRKRKDTIGLILSGIIIAIIFFLIASWAVDEMKKEANLRQNRYIQEIIDNIEIYDPDE